MARTWSDNFVVLNPTAIEKSTGGRDFGVRRLAGASKSAEARRRLTAKSYRFIDLSNLLLSPSQYEELDALSDQAQGSLLPVLAFDARNFLLESGDGTPQPLGTGDGTSKTFQIRKQVPVQGRAGVAQDVKYPFWNYPEFTDLSGNGATVYPELAVLCNGVPVSSLWTVDRESGLISTTLTGILSVTGAFLTKFIFPNLHVAELDGPLYQISSGMRLEEPYED